MLTKTIGQLSAATYITDADLIEIEQSGVSKYASFGMFYIAPGIITPYGGSTAPDGWLLCNGAAVSRTTYADLFAVLSTTWGSGDGSTTFDVPDLREAAPVGIGTSANLITSTGSAISTHDTYTLGQFKDDQMQLITGQLTTLAPMNSGSGAFSTASATPRTGAGGGGANDVVNFSSANSSGARTGTTTRGKRVGVNYIIKY